MSAAWAVDLALLGAGLCGFAAHLLAQYRVAHIMRQRYPKQWNIVVGPGNGRRRLRTFSHLQKVLRSRVPEMFHDAQLTRWHRCWRYGPWIAWPCWLGALVLRAWVAH